ncbi:hypothetical protein [Cerasicoccus frondis]|uniref:hypothetical protein n=1 Tax=Cerasicoccus frondis TaxID=490090 RepID=UPI0028529D2F|nr:hypothetical protein [Cerasicoccus frondis]
MSEKITFSESIWRWLAVTGMTTTIVSVIFWHIIGGWVVTRLYLTRSVMRLDLEGTLIGMHFGATVICLIAGIKLRSIDRQKDMGNCSMAAFCLAIAFSPTLTVGI